MVGNTPVLWIGEPFADAGAGFWAKLEGNNPGGMKDRPALHMVERARSRGELIPGPASSNRAAAPSDSAWRWPVSSTVTR
ncbi:Cysteine synthase [Rhodococcus aetherivorans]|nr:Cysteine synthase [Rhodococcus aetherivorans]